MTNVIKIHWGMNQAWTERRIRNYFIDMVYDHPQIPVSEAEDSFIDYMMEEERLELKVLEDALKGVVDEFKPLAETH